VVIQAIGNIFSTGAPAYVSRTLGAKDYDEVKRTSSFAHYMAILVIVLISILFFILETPILRIIGTAEENIAPTREYLNVIIGLGFIITMQVVMPALLRAEGKVKEAMIGMIIGTGLNIILDPIFILKFHMGAAGAAWATVIGNFFAVVYYIWVFKKRPTNLSISRKDFKQSKRIVTEILKIGFPAAIAQIMMSVANILQNSIASGYGNNAVAAVGVSIKVLTMAAMIITGYSAGYMPFAGYNYGAKAYERVRQGIRFTAALGILYTLLAWLLVILSPHLLLSVFTEDPAMIEAGVGAMRLYFFGFFFMAFQFTGQSAFTALGDSRHAIFFSLLRKAVIVAPLTVLLPRFGFGVDGVFLAEPVSNAIGGVACFVTMYVTLYCRLNCGEKSDHMVEL